MIGKLKDSVKNANPEELLDCLSELAASTEDHNTQEQPPIDDLLVKSYFILSKSHLHEFVEILYDLIVLMRDPRNVVVHLLNHQRKEDTESLHISKFVYFIMRNYDFKFNGFYENLVECLTVENLDEEKLYFLVGVFHENRDLSAGLMKKAVKRLMGLSLEGSSHLALSILYSLLFILRSNPVLYNMTNDESEGGILGELEIHSESLDEIAAISRMIKKEAQNKNLRVKFVNITSMKYPSLLTSTE